MEVSVPVFYKEIKEELDAKKKSFWAKEKRVCSPSISGAVKKGDRYSSKDSDKYDIPPLKSYNPWKYRLKNEHWRKIQFWILEVDEFRTWRQKFEDPF